MSAPEAEIFETKLTRTEVLDLILDDLTEELDRQIKPLAAALEAVRKIGPALADFLPLMPKDALVKVESDWNGDGKTRWVKIRFPIKASQVPKSWTERLKEEERLGEEVQALREQRSKLTENRRRAQNAIIRRSLEASSDGRRVLETVGKFKLALKAKLLGAGR